MPLRSRSRSSSPARTATGLLVLLLLPAAIAASHAAEAVTVDGRPRIGLVLSGGGARGAAHVGVIRALEEMRVPIDAVAGTSMGAVVGGLYSAGLSGAEIEEVFRNLDWQDLFRDRAPRRDLVYRRKQDDRSIYARGSLGLRYGEGIELPLGLVQGQKITQALRSATLGVADVTDFDRLPTPFRALATDLETGEPVVLDHGDLATVLRASMSAPGVLAPVEVGGRLLVDGGLVDNLPVGLARSMGVDVLIVVDVSFPLATRKDLQVAVRRDQPDARHHGPARHRGLQGAARGTRRADRARSRTDDGARFRTGARGHDDRADTVAGGTRSSLPPSRCPRSSTHAIGRNDGPAESPTRSIAFVRPGAARCTMPTGSRPCSVTWPASRSMRRSCNGAPTGNTVSIATNPSTTCSCATATVAGSRSTCGRNPGARASCDSGSASRATTTRERARTRRASC